MDSFLDDALDPTRMMPSYRVHFEIWACFVPRAPSGDPKRPLSSKPLRHMGTVLSRSASGSLPRLVCFPSSACVFRTSVIVIKTDNDSKKTQKETKSIKEEIGTRSLLPHRSNSEKKR